MPFQKGQSGNPGGRPKNAVAGLSREILERTEDGRELVAALLNIVRSPGARARDRLDAIGMLLDRGLGRPHATSEVRVGAAAPALPDNWDALSPAQRAEWLDRTLPMTLLAEPAS